MAWFGKANESAWLLTPESDMESEVEGSLEETNVLPGALAIQASINKCHDFVSRVEELMYPGPTFIIGVCLSKS
jgi:hypothetical protein